MIFFGRTPKILRRNCEERLFLENLDKRLHYVDEKKDRSITHSVDRYHNRGMDLPELRKLCSLIGENAGFELAITPINTNYNLSLGFDVFYAPDKFSLVKFIEKQLPQGYTFERLVPVFMREDNLTLHRKYSIVEPVNDRFKYKP